MGNRPTSWVVGMVLSTVLAVVVVTGTAAWVVAGERPARARQDVRAEVIRAATDGVVAINSVQPQTLITDLDRAESVLAEPMLSEYRRVRPQYEQNLESSQAQVVARPGLAGIERDDPVRPTVVVGISVTARSATAAPQDKHQLFVTEMVQVDGVWKLSSASPSA